MSFCNERDSIMIRKNTYNELTYHFKITIENHVSYIGLDPE